MFKIIRRESRRCQLLANGARALSKTIGPQSTCTSSESCFHRWSKQGTPKSCRPCKKGGHCTNMSSSKHNLQPLYELNKEKRIPNLSKLSAESISIKCSTAATTARNKADRNANQSQKIATKTDTSTLPTRETTQRFHSAKNARQLLATTSLPNLSTQMQTKNIAEVSKTTTRTPTREEIVNSTKKCYSGTHTGQLTTWTNKAKLSTTLSSTNTERSYISPATEQLSKLTTHIPTKALTRHTTREEIVNSTKKCYSRTHTGQPTTWTNKAKLSTTLSSTNTETSYISAATKQLSKLTTHIPTKALTRHTGHYSTNATCARKYATKSSRKLKRISAEEAAALIKPNSVVFVEGVVGTPKILMNAMYDYVKDNRIQGVTVLDVFSLYPYERMTMEDDCVRRLSFFVSPFTRKYVNAGKAEYIPLMLNDLPLVFDRGYYAPDVALISVSPPDSDGFVSLGTNLTELLSVIAASKLVIAQVNDKMPRSLGAALIHESQIDYGVDVSYELFSPASEPVTDIDRTIANLICDELIEDEATLQIGLGKIPEAILTHVEHHKNLGVHTELLTSAVLPLIQAGIINNTKKSIDRDIITATLLLGDKALYDFVHNNETVQMKPCSYSNDPAIIRQNHRMTAINTCLEIDLTGQVVSDSLGSTIYSGFGGQVDFMRGAMTGLDGRGKAILALASRDEKTGDSKIVGRLKSGAGVVCTRAHVNLIVTEYGVADLCGRSTRQRAHDLIRLSHPEHRERLEREAFELLGVMPCA